MPKRERTEAIETLVGETRARREALHDLVGRLRGELDAWNQEAATLPRRARLTPLQRQKFRGHLLRLAQRRGR